MGSIGRGALSHSLPDQRHTSCMPSLIGQFHINEYACTLAAVTCVGYSTVCCLCYHRGENALVVASLASSILMNMHEHWLQ